MHLDAAAFDTNENSQKLVREVEDLHSCVKRNQAFVPNYEERVATWKRSLRGRRVGDQSSGSKRIVKKQLTESAWGESSRC
jgi:hypothetical protein